MNNEVSLADELYAQTTDTPSPVAGADPASNAAPAPTATSGGDGEAAVTTQDQSAGKAHESDNDGDRSQQSVPLGILRAEREKRQGRDAEVARLREENELLRRGATSAQGTQQPQADQTPEVQELVELEQLITDDEPLTAKQAKRYVELSQTVAQRQAQAREAEQVRTSLMAAHQEAIETLTADKLGEGLDYKTVWTAGFENLSNRDRQRIEAAGNDAGALLYELCIERTPALRRRLQDHQTKQAQQAPPSASGKPPAQTNATQSPAAPAGKAEASTAPDLDTILNDDEGNFVDQLTRIAYPLPKK